MGVSSAQGTEIPYHMLEASARDTLDPIVPRVYAVLHPLHVHIKVPNP